MTIGDLSRRTGLPASTLRYWERIGVLPKPARLNGRRRYAPDAPARAAVLQLAQRCGFTLPEMRRLLHGFRDGEPPSQRWESLARSKQAEIETRIADLRAMQQLLNRVLECRCADLLECGRLAAGGS